MNGSVAPLHIFNIMYQIGDKFIITFLLIIIQGHS